ncbi:MAG: hypothetical protein JRJ84_22260 [Deltaproteobacteria bacterium]|nr:hypothetical protein [Deltaproteobacteria bacterium]
MSLLLLAATALLTVQPAFAAPTPEQQQSMTGRFVSAEEESTVRARIDQSVEHTAMQFPWAIRPLARPRLREGAIFCPDFSTHLEAETLTIQCAGKSALVRRLDGSDGPFTLEKGKAYDTDIQLEDVHTLAVSYVGERGNRDVRYVFRADGVRLLVSVYGPHLTTPMQWDIDYRRVE